MSFRLNTFTKFLLVGVTNTAIGLSTIYSAINLFNFGDLSANITGYVVGILWGYWLNKKWTFSVNKKSRSYIVRYFAVCGIAYGLNLIVIITLRALTDPKTFLPHVGGMICYTVFAYLGSRYFVFNDPVDDSRASSHSLPKVKSE